MGFHGVGWDDDQDFDHKFQTAAYADVDNSHKQEYEDMSPVSVADEFNVYSIKWTSEKVTWKFNGELVRKVTDIDMIPALPLQARIHSRSGYCNQMPEGDSFQVFVKSYQYTPWDPSEVDEDDTPAIDQSRRAL